MTVAELLQALSSKFKKIEKWGMRVGSLWLREEDVDLLATHQDFDRNANGTLLMHLPELRGYLWGATVNASPHVPEGHVAIIQDDFDAKLLGPGGCEPFGPTCDQCLHPDHDGMHTCDKFQPT